MILWGWVEASAIGSPQPMFQKTHASWPIDAHGLTKKMVDTGLCSWLGTVAPRVTAHAKISSSPNGVKRLGKDGL